jgi:8-oxo-dGTP pyrophosphatase MutT (NUDIX family)
MSETIDLVDKNGTPVKFNVPRDDAAEYPGLHMQIVIAVIFNRLGQVLVHKRSAQKKVNPGDIDFVCGGVQAGETPEAAVIRESEEDTGVIPTDLRIIREDVNVYNRYCRLYVGTADAEPGVNLDPEEIAWARYYDPAELQAARKAGTLTFVDGFFEDLEAAQKSRA